MGDKSNEPIGETLGEIHCPDCGGPAYVKRTKRRGHSYMSNCPECGIDQKTGKATQDRMAKYVPVGTLQAKGQSEEPLDLEKPQTKMQSESSAKTSKSPVKAGSMAFLGMALLGLIAVVS